LRIAQKLKVGDKACGAPSYVRFRALELLLYCTFLNNDLAKSLFEFRTIQFRIGREIDQPLLERTKLDALPRVTTSGRLGGGRRVLLKENAVVDPSSGVAHTHADRHFRLFTQRWYR
jgi:hypothetical protein